MSSVTLLDGQLLIVDDGRPGGPIGPPRTRRSARLAARDLRVRLERAEQDTLWAAPLVRTGGPGALFVWVCFFGALSTLLRLLLELLLQRRVL